MGSLDSKPSSKHSSFDPGLYSNQEVKDPSSLEIDKQVLAKHSTNEVQDFLIDDPFLGTGLNGDDHQLIEMIKTSEGTAAIKTLCTQPSLKMYLVSLGQNVNNPDLQRVLQNAVFTQPSAGAEIHYPSRTVISDLITENPHIQNFLSRLFTRMTDSTLVHGLLNELQRSGSATYRSFLLDTIPQMDDAVTVPEILEISAQNQNTQDVLQYLLTKIVDDHGRDSGQPADHGNQAVVEINTHDAVRQMNKRDNASPGAPSSRSPLQSSMVVDPFSVITATEHLLSVAGSRIFIQISWVRDALVRVQESLSNSQPLKIFETIKNQLEEWQKPKMTGVMPGVTPPTARPSFSLLMENMQNSDFQVLKNFVAICSDERLIDDMIHDLSSMSSNSRERVIEMIVEMPPFLTVPLILEHQLELIKLQIDISALLAKIHETHEPEPASVDERPASEMVTPRPARYQPALDMEQEKTSELHQDPRLSAILEIMDERFNAFFDDYLSSPRMIEKQLPTLMRTIAGLAEEGAISAKTAAKIENVLTKMGHAAVPILLEYQTTHGLSSVINRVLQNIAVGDGSRTKEPI